MRTFDLQQGCITHSRASLFLSLIHTHTHTLSLSLSLYKYISVCLSLDYLTDYLLDPFREFDEDELWQVLESVNIKDHVLSLPKKLEEEVSEGGDNFSAGQRQVSQSLVSIS